MAVSPLEWVVLDGDNTLWDVECLYDRAREKLCQMLAQFGLDPAEVDRFQRQHDVDLHELHGYSPARFPQSFADTVQRFLGDSDQYTKRRAWELANDVFSSRAPPMQDVDRAIERLRRRYSLALLTAGDAVVQTRRLEAFGRAEHFAAARIVPNKSAEVLESFLDHYAIPRENVWVVGDSLRSDIAPAIALGVRAIHLNVANWHPVEGVDMTLPASCRRATSLIEVCGILGC